jgi:ATP-dependent DNA helicase RecG
VTHPPTTILDRQLLRNRRLADALARWGLVERADPGANLMFGEAIRAGKPLPDFSASDAYQVSVVIRAEIEGKARLEGARRTARWFAQDGRALDRAGDN